MAVFRINKTDNYTVMSNHHLKDKNLSLKGKGLLSVMLSLPKEWDYSIAGLCKILRENETAVKSALKDLKECGYLVVTKKYANETVSHRIEYEYDIYETPNQEVICQPLEPLGVEHLYIETPGQLNTNNKILKNKIHNNREVDNNQTIPEKHKELTDLTIEELEQLKQLVLENRDTQTITYREIQKKFNLIDPVTYDTPTLCSKLIKQIKDTIRKINSTERCTGFSGEIF